MATAAPNYRDYSLTGPEGKLAIKKGLASAEWFVPHVERKTLRRLMQVRGCWGGGSVGWSAGLVGGCWFGWWCVHMCLCGLGRAGVAGGVRPTAFLDARARVCVWVGVSVSFGQRRTHHCMR